MFQAIAQNEDERRPAAVDLSAASVAFGRGENTVTALQATTLRVSEGEFLALVGPSGCGKSTILKLASGLLKPSSGAVIVGGREVEAKAQRIGMAFQNPTLLPWLTIERNVMLPLKIVHPFRQDYARKKCGEYRDRVHAMLQACRTGEIRQPLPVAAVGRHVATREPVPGIDP